MRAVVFAVLLAGCAVATQEPSKGIAPLRDPAQPVASQVDVRISGLEGRWHIIDQKGLFSPFRDVRISGDMLTFSDGPDLVVFSLETLGEGRFALIRPGTAAVPLWVHWADTGRRTAALGNPDGAFWLVIDRTRTASPDRIRAARDILDWYGYKGALGA